MGEAGSSEGGKRFIYVRRECEDLNNHGYITCITFYSLKVVSLTCHKILRDVKVL
jgi:hypothetical protein